MDDFDIDPAMAEAMGFTSFGSKRRKHNPHGDDAFVDTTANHLAASTGANNMPLGTRVDSKDVSVITQEQGAQNSKATMDTGEKAQTIKEGGDLTDNWTPGFPSAQELQALRRGIKNARGDMVVFMPSFIEDPWKGLS